MTPETQITMLSALIMPPGLIDRPEVPILPANLIGVGLRDYQWLMLLEAARLMRIGHRRILLQAPTGAGKTVIATALMGGAARQGLSSEFIVHRKELIKQTSVAFTARGLTHGFVAAGWPNDPNTGITLAGVQTLANRLAGLFPPNLVICDEAHHATSETWARVLSSYKDAYVIGLTATPERLDGRGLAEHFDVMVQGPSVATLIRRGFLAPFEFYAPVIPEMDGIASVGGDFAVGATAAVVDKPKLVGDIVEHYLRLAPGEQGIVFAVSREHSRHIAAAFQGEGVAARHVDGSMSDKERDRFDAEFRAGDIRIGVNVDLFGEGYDVPNITYVGDAAPSRSLSKVMQRWGRALRPPKRAVICDHAGNSVPRHLGGRGHGLPDTARTWSLQGRPKKKSNGAGQDAEPITQCKTCFRVYPSVAARCPGCGVEPPPKPRVVQTEAGTLTKLEKQELALERSKRLRREVWACTTFSEMISLAKARNYDRPKGWASIQCKMRGIPRVLDK